jgi:hypothetical protein
MHNRKRMTLALALYEVEVAHAHLGKANPSDKHYGRRVQDLAYALQEYWRVDKQTENYLHRAGGN